ncbi:lysozyme [Kluyvera intermedia]|uniref:lysozyme n=1 Tax=Kluyvera intermedia TaxID=61648 RepID=UPI001F1A1E5D|nr:lysozyme [Kluyvera intermedia]EKU4731417.1 lysozyme [Kluyvera ascorbata]MCE9887268.1 lysozyme [Kluyvera intermedia]
MPLAPTMPSPQGLDFIKRYQGLSLEKYCDEDGLWLIGYGHLIRDHETFDAPITHWLADTLFTLDVGYYLRVLHQCVRSPLTQSQFDAVLSLAFSLGPEAVQKSPIVDCINQQKFQSALALWQGEGERQSSLAVQRQAESALFQTDIR